MSDDNRNDHEARVIAAISRAARRPVEEISRESTFEELGVESLEAIEIIFELEDEFDISIEDEGIREMKNIGQVVDAVGDYLDAGQAAAKS